MTKNAKKTGLKRPKNAKISKIFFSSFFYLETTSKMVLAVFTQCLVPEINIFGHFWLKSAFLGPKYNQTEICTAKPMVVGCVQHYSTHFGKN